MARGREEGEIDLRHRVKGFADGGRKERKMAKKLQMERGQELGTRWRPCECFRGLKKGGKEVGRADNGENLSQTNVLCSTLKKSSRSAIPP